MDVVTLAIDRDRHREIGHLELVDRVRPEASNPDDLAALDRYAIDFRREIASYYVADGDFVERPTHEAERTVAASFDATRIQAAVSQAQQLVPGFTYLGFCEKVTAAGCAGYLVSFLGRRVIYIWRTAETYVEHFPGYSRGSEPCATSARRLRFKSLRSAFP